MSKVLEVGKPPLGKGLNDEGERRRKKRRKKRTG